MRALVVTVCIAALAAAPAYAEPSERLADAIEGLLTHYGHLAGEVAACDPTESSDTTKAMAAMVAAWRYPGLWDGFTGTRGDYQAQIESAAMGSYLDAMRKPCDAGRFAQDMMTVIRDEAGRALELETRLAP